MTPTLQVEGLECHWEDGTAALRGISFTVPPASRVALLGANGCGKSSLLMALNGSFPASCGRILLDGLALRYSRQGLRDWRQQVGLVLSDPNHMLVGGTVAADISFGPLNLGFPEDIVRKRVEQVIAAFGLERWRDYPVTSISAGVKKRVSLAGIVAMDPSVVLLDEPANGLDAPGNRALLAALDTLSADGRLLMVATHDTEFAWRWASHWLVLEEGRVAYFGVKSGAGKYLAENPEGIALPIEWAPHH